MSRLTTNISEVFWCTQSEGRATFQPAHIAFGTQPRCPTAWLDGLLEGGIEIPETGNRPLTMLISGPPGAGKSTLAMEMAYHFASRHDKFCLYISTEVEAARIIETAQSFIPEKECHRYLKDYESKPVDNRVVAVWGTEHIANNQILSDMANSALDLLVSWVKAAEPASMVSKSFIKYMRTNRAANEVESVVPNVLIVDSLNIIPEPKERASSFQDFLNALSANEEFGGTRLVIFILNSNSAQAPEFWEYAADLIVRLDISTVEGYTIRTLEITKARYQAHVCGRHQFKIYSHIDQDTDSFSNDDTAKIRQFNIRQHRQHPYRTRGGIFVYPSLHYFLSRYKRIRPSHRVEYIEEVVPDKIGSVLRLPMGRCTAFVGMRGGHKSHLAYLNILNRVVRKNERVLIVSLRDDEQMTRATMQGILERELGMEGAMLDELESDDKFEILYYPPGYITPEEFFHRMFISLQRLKRPGSGSSRLNVMFNSLDQLGSRFPLCARERIFVPGMVECLAAEGATSIFIAVDEEGQPKEQYGLLPMADLIVRFAPKTLTFDEYRAAVKRVRPDISAQKVEQARLEWGDDRRDEVMLRIERFAGGQKGGAGGLLELVDDPAKSLHDDVGLRFTRWGPAVFRERVRQG